MDENGYEPRERAWWQAGSDKGFVDRVESMPLIELEATLGDIKGALAIIQSQLEARPEENGSDWWARARQALGIISRRSHLLKAVISRKNMERRGQNEMRKAVLIAGAREAIERGDLGAALSLVLDLLEGAHARDR